LTAAENEKPTSKAAAVGTESDKSPPPRIYPILRDGLLGFMDRQGRVVLEPQFEMFFAGHNTEPRLLLGHHSPVAEHYITKSRPPWGMNEYFSGFSDDVTVVCRDQWFGFVRRDGKVIVEPQFRAVTDFHDGFAWGAVKGGCRLVNREGQILTGPFERVTWFSDGLAAVKKDGKWGFIAEDGHMVIAPRFDNVEPQPSTAPRVHDPVFVNGLAVVSENGKFGIIDRCGQYVVEPEYEGAGPVTPVGARVWRGDKCGFVDCRGRLTIPLADQSLNWNVSEGLIPVKWHEKYGYLDLRGTLVIPAIYDLAFVFHEGVAEVKVGQKYGYIDQRGRWVVEPRFPKAEPYSEGVAIVATEEEKWGVIDVFGQFVVPPRYDQIKPFSSGLAVVRSGDRYGVVDRTGRMVLEAKYEYVDRSRPDELEATINGKECIFDLSGRVLVPPIYDIVDWLVEGRRVVKNGEKYGYIDAMGKVVVPLKFDFAERYDVGIARVGIEACYSFGCVTGGKWGYIDLDGNWVWEPSD
jgi:hypothetical protein